MTIPTAAPPGLPDDLETEFFWDGTRAGELRILRCQDCGFYIHLPRPVCRNCQSMNVAGEAVSGKATLYSWTVTHKPFHPYFVDRVPYVLATVELVEQPKLHFAALLVDLDPSEIEIGMALTVVFDDRGDGNVVPGFTADTTQTEETK